MDMDVEAMEVDVVTEKEVEMEAMTTAKRAKREGPICHESYQKLTDHLHKKQNPTERPLYLQEAIKRTPDLHVQSN